MASFNRELWKKRQELHSKVRDFFVKRSLLEVDVPMLSAACGMDPQLDYFETYEPTRYLATSPEFFMKRLLAQGFGDIFSLTHAFRKGEFGRLHNPEFNIAEWYRVGVSAEDLQLEILDLVNEITNLNLPLKRTTWQAAFEKIDIENCEGWTLEEREDYAMSCIIGPSLGKNCAEFIVDYPPARAALAKIRNGFACRFELYVNGMEICNGYEELANAEEQRERFLKEAQKRREMGKPVPKIDDNFLEALKKGMPECCGVALGLDRLYMLALGESSLENVLLFTDGEA